MRNIRVKIVECSIRSIEVVQETIEHISPIRDRVGDLLNPPAFDRHVSALDPEVRDLPANVGEPGPHQRPDGHVGEQPQVAFKIVQYQADGSLRLN